MNDTPQPSPASPVRRTAGRAARAGFSLIWLVPIIALVVVLGLAWNAYSSRGELISVVFQDATGITPGETALKFREITVGEVEAVRFTADLRNVVVDIRVEPDVAPYIDADAEFWMVRPVVSAQGISRLDTVLSGVFIEGFWDAEKGRSERHFVALDRPTQARTGGDGTWVVLSSPGAKGLSEGAPVTFRGLEVGRMQNLRLSEDDETVLADVFIEAPHDERLSTASAFWDTSGFSVSLSSKGLSLNVDSLTKLVQGGVAFATMSTGGEPVEPGHIFRLQPDEEAARTSLFGSSKDDLRLSILTDNDIVGLNTDSDVTYKGLPVGRVTDLGVDIDESRPLGEEIKQRITFVLSPSRLGLEGDATPEKALTFLKDRVAAGLRARVASSGFLGNALGIELLEEALSPPDQLKDVTEGHPIMPTVAPNISDLGGTAEGLLSRIGGLKLEEVVQSATNMMDAVTQIAGSPETRAIPKALRETLEDTRAAVADLRTVTQQLREGDATGNLTNALDKAGKAAEAVSTAVANVPDMVDKMDRAAAAIEEFDFARVSDQASGILGDLRAMLGTEDAAQLPRNLSDTLRAATGLLTKLGDGNAVGNLNATLESTRTAADEIAVAAASLPDLAKQIEDLAKRMDGVIASYGSNGAFNTQARAMMQELSRSALAVGSLARTIERNPTAFITGR